MQQPALIGPGGNVQETPSSWRDSWKSQSQWKKPQRPWNKWQSENWKKSKPQDRPAASYDVKEATPEEIKAAEARKAAADKAGQEELSLEDEEADDGEYLKALWESANTAAWAQRLCEQGLRLSFPALALCLSLRLYQGGRTVVGESQPSPTIFPGRGMIQGCPYAPTLAKLTMSEPLHRLKRVTGLHHCDVWLDDVSADSLHASPDIAAGAAYEAFRVLKASLQAEGLVLSQEKTRFVAGTPRSAAALRQLLRPGDPDIVDVVKDLGLDSGSGRRRRTTTAQKRFRVGSLRNLKLGKLRIPSRRVRLRLHRSSVVTSGLYGHEAQGVAPKHMKTMRAAVARHAGRSRYGSTDTILDMTAHEVQDPYLIVVTQHVESLFRMMARCNRMGWEAVKDTWRVVWKRLEAAKHGWSVVTGPISAMCQYLRDLQVDGHEPSRWVFEERVLEIKPSEVSVVCQTSSFLMDIIKTQRSPADRPLSARELVEKGQLEPWWKYPWNKIAAQFAEASEYKPHMSHLSVPDAVAGRMATIMGAFRHYGRPLEGDGDLAQKVGPEMFTFDVPGQNVLFVGCNIKGPSFVHDPNYANQATMCHGTSFASVIGVAQCGEITVGDNREDGFPAYGFSARGALVGYSKDSMVAAVKKTASRAKSLGGAMLVVEAELPGPTPQVEGGHDYLHSACRDSGSVRSGEHFLLSPKHVVLRGIAVGWPR